MLPLNAQKIIFDLDGTLIDSAPDLHAATNHVLETLGRDLVSLQQVRNMVGHGALVLIEKGLMATGGMNGNTAEALRPVFLDYYSNNITTHTRPFDGTKAMLEHFRALGVEMAICTNKPIVLVEPILKNLGMLEYFGAITGGDTFSFKKPDPRHLLETAARLEGDGPIVMVGDSAPDIGAARNAGVPSVAVTFGYSQDPVETLGADHVIDHLSDLTRLISPAG